MVNGIYTLANDVVYDQLVALLNSIDVNAGSDVPVCVIAYDDHISRVQAEVNRRPNVTLLNDPALFRPWEDFSVQVWQTHATALQTWRDRGIQGVRRIGMNRRYCAFDPDAPFEQFAYFDADALVLNRLDHVFQPLDHSDIVVYDFQYKDPSHIYNIHSPRLAQVFPLDRVNREIFCAGFYASKRGFFAPDQRDWLVSQLQQGDSEVLYIEAPNQSVLNYMVMKSGLSVYNLALQLPAEQRTGNSVTSSHFEQRDHRLFDKGSPLTYLHYIGLSSKLFQSVCQGENINFPYRETFLHYRYLHEPEKRPRFSGKAVDYDAPPGLMARMMKKLTQGLARK